MAGSKGIAKVFKKKGSNKKAKAIPFSKKEWYDIVTPAVFEKAPTLKTLVNRTAGKKTAEGNLLDRVIDMNVADIYNVKDLAVGSSYMKMKLKIEHTENKKCFTRFHGMELTSDKLRSMVRRWQTLIEGDIEVKTVDGYILRIFPIVFTRRSANSTSKTSYAKTSIIKEVRRIMSEIIYEDISNMDINNLIRNLISEEFARKILFETKSVAPLKEFHIRKVKVLKAPSLEIIEETMDNGVEPRKETVAFEEPEFNTEV
eukprot:GHVP01061620.1.p1 GENE.GHVP01061620.1~~GHVP01061620.1.p1  ORF type:complete len:258 (+),score=53.89 GHVP01061620.1:783-1556(+)